MPSNVPNSNGTFRPIKNCGRLLLALRLHWQYSPKQVQWSIFSKRPDSLWDFGAL